MLSFLLILLTGCKEKLQQGTLANLYVRYDADIRQLKAEATFHELINGEKGGSKVFPQGVQFINSGMRTVDLPGGEVRYKAGVAGLLPKETYFNWYGPKGMPITIPALIAKINGFEVEKDTISLSKGISIYLNTSNLEQNEKLVISITDEKGKVKTLETKGPTATTKFKIPGTEIRGLSGGEAQIYIVRTRAHQVEGETHKAIVNTEYYSVAKEIEIVE